MLRFERPQLQWIYRLLVDHDSNLNCTAKIVADRRIAAASRAAVNELEREFPGIVRRARDPWGNTPLWNTFFNLEPTEKLHAELLRRGCDPNALNEWGLSYQLLKDNDPKAMRYPALTSSDPATLPR